MAETEKWPEFLTTSKQVADALNWLRWRTKGSGLIFIAIGVNSVSIARDPALAVEDAIETVSLEIDTIARLIRALEKAKPNTHGSVPRPAR